MRKLTEGNKTNFAIFAIVIIAIIIVLTSLLTRVLEYEKEVYTVTKDVAIYDINYEYIDLTSDAVIEKKWTGEYYLNEPETGLNYELGNNAIAYDSIKNRLSLYGTLYEVSMDGDVTKTTKNTEVVSGLEPKLYKIDDRKYLLVADEISNELGTLDTENYLIIVIDKSGNTMLLNNKMAVKTINALVLETDTFKFDVANERLIYNDTKIDLKKIIGSSNQYIEPKTEDKEKTEEENKDEEDKKEEPQTITVGGGTANSSTTTVANSNGGTYVGVENAGQSGSISIGSNNSNSNSNNDNNNDKNNSSNDNNGNSNNNSNSTSNISANSGAIAGNANNLNNQTQNTENSNSSQTKNITKAQKSVSLRGVNPGETFLDIEYTVIDPENEYQVVFITLSGGGATENISLDKNKNYYRVTGLKQNTDYTVTLGVKEIKSNSTVEEITEDVINVKTLKVQGELKIIKITSTEIFFNLKIDKNASYDEAKIYMYIDNSKQDDYITVNTDKALQTSGWTSSIPITEEMQGKITLVLEDVPELDVKASIQIY